MQQRCRVDKLNDCRSANLLIAPIAQRSCREQHDQWAQTLAAAGHDIFRDLRDQHDVALQADADQGIDFAHIFARQRNDVLKSGDCGGIFGGLHVDCDNA